MGQRDIDRVAATPRPPEPNLVSEDIPERKGPGVRVRVLSGEDRHMMMLDIHMAARSSLKQDIPVSFAGFIYVLDGEITAGTKRLAPGQVGWLNDGTGPLWIQAGPLGARSVLYAGERLKNSR